VKPPRLGHPVRASSGKCLGWASPQMFRYNNRKDENGRKLTDAERFALALSQIAGKRLTFAKVTGKVGETPF
jgi:hypothetical protein